MQITGRTGSKTGTNHDELPNRNTKRAKSNPLSLEGEAAIRERGNPAGEDFPGESAASSSPRGATRRSRAVRLPSDDAALAVGLAQFTAFARAFVFIVVLREIRGERA